MTTECRAVLSRISAYLDGELDAPACDRLERHCETCASCATVVRDLKTNAVLCREAGTAPLPDDVLARARERVGRLLAKTEPAG